MSTLKHSGFAVALALFAAAVIAADSPSIEAQIGDVEISKTEQKQADEDGRPPRASCINHCSAASTKCGSEVRRAKQECSRNASMGGRDPMTMRNNDYTYFCGYFGEPGIQCGSDFYSRGCQARFNQRYGMCLDAMQSNITALRHDCYLAERSAQNFCRDELRDCKAACE